MDFNSLISFVSSNKVSILSGLALAVTTGALLKGKGKKQHTFEPGVVYLYDFPKGGFPVIHISPFVLKVSLFLRLNNIPFKVINNFDMGPRNKKPWIRLDEDVVSDSDIIIQYLIKKLNIKGFEINDPDQAAEAHMLRRFIDDAAVWSLVYSRWVDPMNCSTNIEAVFASVPFPMSVLVKRFSLSGTSKQLYSVGISRYERDEIYERAAKDIDALARRLGDKPYLLGNEIALVDVSLFSVLAQFAFEIIQSPAGAALKTHRNLVDYVQRIGEAHFKSNELDFSRSYPSPRQ
ncbi:hypothetical protein SAMD00019534_072760 [Acytostelium subglobosum LB1]|uniref:hypothetical protein n=1 Tax=Acytostelium subglobosum LB1 TaxID=1410327 RepID=UPI000644CE4C|nr:hypothetical protein SAMD00019534_072760 [Acytostelium subglobosum LB1]GAM24101.1 hypothetical protein SAMD00019534_072760 [Acytostelium subglobosum LB1]|eukprot:XP_012753137.1 hypothetical protein SAMD00019534_072760 [Acytostelium subglobosum LB1]